MARSKHPPCPSCSKALYKAPKAGVKVKKSDPYDFCRNTECVRNLVEEISKGPPSVVAENPPEEKQMKLLPRKRKKQKASPPQVIEPPGTFQARKAMRELVKRHMSGKHPDAAALLAALGLQEAGFHSAASVIIKEHALSRKFGVKNLQESSTI